MRKSIFLCFLFLESVVSMFFPPSIRAHGIVGQRFFPATLSVDDPFVADEMDLLGFSSIRYPDGSLMNPNIPPSQIHSSSQTWFSAISKRLTRDVGISVKAFYTLDHFNDPVNGDSNAIGFQNIIFGMMDQMIKIPAHEFIFSSAINIQLGGTGTRSLGNVTPYSWVIPTLFFGYGFGDLPDSLQYLRPFAITGTADLAVPFTDGSSNGGTADYSTGADYGITLMYSTMYLQSFVKDIGLTKPFSRMIPIVEFAFSNNVSGPAQYATSKPAYAYPGILWIGKYTEIGVEAILPMNSNNGSQTGVQLLFHLFLDDWKPELFTRDIFGRVLGPTLPAGQ